MTKKKVGGFLFIVFGILLLGISFFFFDYLRNSKEEKKRGEEKNVSLLPKAYEEAEIPVYPGATIEKTSEMGTPLDKGVRLSLKSNDPVDKISAFFENEMAKKGWEASGQKLIVDGLYLGTFVKGGLYLQIAVSRQGNSQDSQVSLVLGKSDQ